MFRKKVIDVHQGLQKKTVFHIDGIFLYCSAQSPFTSVFPFFQWFDKLDKKKKTT